MGVVLQEGGQARHSPPRFGTLALFLSLCRQSLQVEVAAQEVAEVAARQLFTRGQRLLQPPAVAAAVAGRPLLAAPLAFLREAGHRPLLMASMAVVAGERRSLAAQQVSRATLVSGQPQLAGLGHQPQSVALEAKGV